MASTKNNTNQSLRYYSWGYSRPLATIGENVFIPPNSFKLGRPTSLQCFMYIEERSPVTVFDMNKAYSCHSIT
jgi:hypothetical protein